MFTKTIVALTDQPRKWSSLQESSNKNLNFIIANDIHANEILSSKNKTDLLIISQQNEYNQKLDIQSFSSFIGATYTLIIPPENVDHFVNIDFPTMASTLLANTRTPGPSDTGRIIDPAAIVFSSEQRAGASINLNGYLLGPFHILLNGLLINEFSSRKCKSLLAYLLFHNRRPSFRETLMERFWPDVSPDSARNSLNVAIHGIRQMFRKLVPKKEMLIYSHEKYFFNPEIEIKLDHEDFQFKLKRGQRVEMSSGIQDAISDYEEAVRLYRGDFLEDSLHDEWSYSERENIKEGYLYVLDRLSDYYSLSGKYKIAQHYCRRLLDRDACREDIHRRMMRCLYRTGHRDLAVKQFQKCEAILLKELDISPSKETLDLLAEIKKVC